MATKENRTSGQDEMYAMNNSNKELYKIGIKTERYEAFTKNAFMFNKEHGSNVALILSGSFHNQDSYYGHKYYDVDEKNAYTSLMYESEYGKRHKLSTGISLNYDRFDQWELLNENLLSTDRQKVIESETTPGIYAQYTYNLNDKVIIMAGLRADHSSVFGYFVTPRTHIKIAPSDNFNIRLSAGEGYRTNHVMAENNFLLASGRTIIIDQNLKQDKAWNFGISTTNYIYILNKRMTLNCEYYYTNFVNQVITDVDSDPHSVHFTNLEGSSYSHTFQADVTYPFFRGFTITAAYRLTDVKCTYGGVLLEKPLTSKYKELLTASYSTPLGLMQFDVTLQINGGGRMPSPYTLRDGSLSWNKEYKSFEQLSAQITRFFRFGSIYIGGENLTNFKQKNPIINANDPWSKGFDSTMVWGPLEGSMFYIGLRLNINKI